MRSNLLVVDMAIAAAVATVILIVSPGVAVTAITVLGVLVAVALSFVVEGLHHRIRRRSRARRMTRR